MVERVGHPLSANYPHHARNCGHKPVDEVPLTPERSSAPYRGSDRRLAVARAGGPYRGPDRRGLLALTATGRGLRNAVLVVSLLLLAVVAVHATAGGGRGRVVTFTALRDTGAGLYLLTGTVLLVVWALTGRASRALDGSALLLVGGGLLVLGGPWGALLHHDQIAVLVSPACRLALGVPALAVLIRSPSVVSIDSSVRPIRTLTSAAACALGLLGVEAMLRLWGPIDGSAVLIVAMSALALGWIAAGVRRVRIGESPTSAPGERALGWSLIAFGVGDVLLAVSLGTDLQWGVLGVAVQLLGAVAAASISVSWLLTLLSHDGTRKLLLAGELADVSSVLADEQSGRHRLLHDARNVVAAIRTANVTLERHGERLDPLVQDQLRAAVGSEFVRLQRLFDQPADQPSGPS
jgi:hypothetical protein